MLAKTEQTHWQEPPARPIIALMLELWVQDHQSRPPPRQAVSPSRATAVLDETALGSAHRACTAQVARQSGTSAAAGIRSICDQSGTRSLAARLGRASRRRSPASSGAPTSSASARTFWATWCEGGWDERNTRRCFRWACYGRSRASIHCWARCPLAGRFPRLHHFIAGKRNYDREGRIFADAQSRSTSANVAHRSGRAARAATVPRR